VSSAAGATRLGIRVRGRTIYTWRGRRKPYHTENFFLVRSRWRAHRVNLMASLQTLRFRGWQRSTRYSTCRPSQRDTRVNSSRLSEWRFRDSNRSISRWTSPRYEDEILCERGVSDVPAAQNALAFKPVSAMYQTSLWSSAQVVAASVVFSKAGLGEVVQRVEKKNQ